MKCQRCNSDKVQVQSKEDKFKITVPVLMVGCGLGLMIFGIIGAILGLVLGAIVAVILSAIHPQSYHSVVVCQNCGYVSQPLRQHRVSAPNHPLFCPLDESNLELVRNDAVKGTIIVVRVQIDDYAPFDVRDDSITGLLLTEGVHTLTYEQINGIGKNKNKGRFEIVVEGKKTVTISFTRQGLIVKQ